MLLSDAQLRQRRTDGVERRSDTGRSRRWIELVIARAALQNGGRRIAVCVNLDGVDEHAGRFNVRTQQSRPVVDVR